MKYFLTDFKLQNVPSPQNACFIPPVSLKKNKWIHEPLAIRPVNTFSQKKQSNKTKRALLSTEQDVKISIGNVWVITNYPNYIKKQQTKVKKP